MRDLTALVCGQEEITAEAVGVVWNRWFNKVSEWSTWKAEQVKERGRAGEPSWPATAL
ncbi:hypothetical protein AB0C27_42145 [Nonomuraea sp. NPDC048882]|uniref:hypothetical protein n=1 Tax=unclassified Nonomuraea TaxID=2593643 RepID=UPI000A6553DD